MLRDVGRVLQMPYGQVDRLCKLVPNNPANPVTLAEAIAGEPQAAGGARLRADGRAPARDRPEARRALPPRLDARRRHGDRRPAARGAGAADARSQVQHARHPVQLEDGRGGGSREVRLPRPEDAHGAEEGRRSRQARARHRRRSRHGGARRPQDLRAARQGGYGRRVPAGKHGHAREPEAAAPRPLRGHHRHGGALPPRPHGQHPDLHQPQARRGAGRLPASAAGADPQGDLRRHHLPGAGDPDRAGHGRLYARPGRHAAPRHGQEGQGRDGAATRRASSRARSSAASARRTPSTSSSWSTSSPATASTRATPPPTRSSATTPPT